jgi:hypothetical protein
MVLKKTGRVSRKKVSKKMARVGPRGTRVFREGVVPDRA